MVRGLSIGHMGGLSQPERYVVLTGSHEWRRPYIGHWCWNSSEVGAFRPPAVPGHPSLVFATSMTCVLWQSKCNYLSESNADESEDKMKRFIAIGVFALALTSGVANAADVFVRFGPPPPPREVVVVQPSRRHVWVPGYYQWHHGRYVWTNGYWAVPPRGRAAWVPGYWAPRRGGYIWFSGHWR